MNQTGTKKSDKDKEMDKEQERLGERRYCGSMGVVPSFETVGRALLSRKYGGTQLRYFRTLSGWGC